MPLTAGLALTLAAVIGTSTPLNTAQIMPQAQTVQEYVETYFASEPIMVAIAGCESHFQQYGPDGSVYRGQINPKDVGVMQINEHYHKKQAQELGLDLYTIQGNVAYAQYLYDKAGTAPRDSSKACWDKSAAYQAFTASSTASSPTLALANQ